MQTRHYIAYFGLRLVIVHKIEQLVIYSPHTTLSCNECYLCFAINWSVIYPVDSVSCPSKTLILVSRAKSQVSCFCVNFGIFLLSFV